MTLIETIRNLIGLDSNDDEMSGLDALQGYLEMQSGHLSIEVVFGEPTLDTNGKPTAVFPYDAYLDGERYGVGEKQFVIPDGGLGVDSNLRAFLEANGVEPSIEALGDIEGVRAAARIDEKGDTRIEY